MADTIYNLSNNPKSPVQGWCYASKETLAKILDTTRQTIHNSINKLTEKVNNRKERRNKVFKDHWKMV